MTVLLDNGHGGLINGLYQTKGKQVRWKDNEVFYEGEFNRAIVNGIMQELTKLQIPYINLVPEHQDISLRTRVKRANNYAGIPCFYLSIHANAGGGAGAEFFTSPGDTKSDAIASRFGEAFQQEFPNDRLRTDYSDGDLDKEARFYVLTKTKMPAVLTESFFMDNYTEYKNYLSTSAGRMRIVDYHVAAIQRINNELFKKR